MPDAPAADWPIDVHVAARLVAHQHPEFAGAVRLVGNGWDNVVFRLGDAHALRMPRRRLAVPLIEFEQRWLPELAESLPLPIPAPVAVGVPGDGFPFPWSIVPWFGGTAVWSTEPADRVPLARPLARFVAALRRPAPADAPFNPVRAVPLGDRDEVVRARIARAGAPELLELWADGVAAPVWDGAPQWVHGDLHGGNLVAVREDDGALRLEAVIDWGDLSAGDPAGDLTCAWTIFDADGRAEFFDELERFGALDPHLRRRGRAWAAGVTSSMLAETSGEGDVARMGRFALEQLRAERSSSPARA
ncbi:aminoglycoside phosphotransferase family protein [Agromyces seonyuensis]|uniref:Phosphotransferase n=1 Tax=Agromyces seonyuensis TaxID=2662446 RepID=A0A6I4P244_9MICO|nr:aminoglycoside phosphotransferase family protein [Agromyces seonyuensis]MWB99662.1 phosphotransferase [Agromyces seonyuensis]